MKTVLIVDDEPAARYGLRRALESRYRIAGSGFRGSRRARRCSRRRRILLLLDVVMPGEDGLGVFEMVAQRGPRLCQC